MKTKSHGWRSMRAGLLALTALALCCSTAAAQLTPRGPVHPQYWADMPPGAIGQQQLARGGPVHGYYQPVEIVPPEDASVSLLVDGRFQRPQQGPARVGLQIGQVYRFKITGIPGNAGFEVYPSLEVIDRLYPPPGQATQHPIPVHVTTGDLEIALSGRFVTRVIYLEDPSNPFPYAEEPGRQRYFEVPAAQDPLQVADELGRPMAILRMGSRVPDFGEVNGLAFGSPQLLQFPVTTPAAQPIDGNGSPEKPQAGSNPQAKRPGIRPRPDTQSSSLNRNEKPRNPIAGASESNRETQSTKRKSAPGDASVQPHASPAETERAMHPGPAQTQFLPVGDPGAKESKKNDVAKAEYVAPTAKPKRRLPVLPARLFKFPATK